MEIWNTDKAFKLDNEKRKKSLPPKETLIKLGLKKGFNIADIGCGIGYFSIPAAHIIGENSKVYAIDTSIDMINILLEKLKNEKLKNVQVKHSNGYDLNIISASVEFAFCCNVLHEVKDKEKFLREINRIVDKKGIFAIIEWKKIQTGAGPAIDKRIAYEELKNIIEKNGFTEIEKVNLNQSLYGITARKL